MALHLNRAAGDLIRGYALFNLLKRQRLARLYLSLAITGFVLVGSACEAQADSAANYVSQAKQIFEHLFQGKHFAPDGSACNRIPGRCDALLSKLATSAFSFIAPFERSDRPNMPMFRGIKRECSIFTNLTSEFDGVPADPTRGFALYRVPGGMPSRKDQQIYILRAEDYVSQADDRKVLDDGGFIVFSYPNCQELKQFSIEKSRKSSYNAASTNQELKWISEPVLLEGTAFILSIFAINDPTAAPLYVLHLTSVLGLAASGGEAYSFSARK